MAKPVDFPEKTTVVGGGGAFHDAPVYRDGARMITFHALTPDELMEIMQTGGVWVINPGNTYPGTVVSGKSPFDKTVN